MQYYLQMPIEAKKKKKNLLSKAGMEHIDKKVLSEFASLANWLGFKSILITALMGQSPDVEIAYNALLKA
jgi:hypothetical protein